MTPSAHSLACEMASFFFYVPAQFYQSSHPIGQKSCLAIHSKEINLKGDKEFPHETFES